MISGNKWILIKSHKCNHEAFIATLGDTPAGFLMCLCFHPPTDLSLALKVGYCWVQPALCCAGGGMLRVQMETSPLQTLCHQLGKVQSAFSCRICSPRWFCRATCGPSGRCHHEAFCTRLGEVKQERKSLAPLASSPQEQGVCPVGSVHGSHVKLLNSLNLPSSCSWL